MTNTGGERGSRTPNGFYTMSAFEAGGLANAQSLQIWWSLAGYRPLLYRLHRIPSGYAIVYIDLLTYKPQILAESRGFEPPREYKPTATA
jgi:hypothetical protein